MTGPVGSRVGEIFLRLRDRVRDNDGKVFGSRWLGAVVIFLLDPVGHLTRGISDLLGMPIAVSVKSSRSEYWINADDHRSQGRQLVFTIEF